MMTSLSNLVTRGIGSQSLKLQANAPKLLFAGGVVGMVGSTVLACRSTLRLHEVLNEVEENINAANAARELHPDMYSEEEKQKDTAIIYFRSGMAIAKLYAPSIVLGAASVAMLSKSHNLLEERNAALTAAYVALDRGFREYRQRVVDKYGDEQDQQFRYSTETVSVTQEGTGKKVKETRVSPEAQSIYARFFDEYSEWWSKEPEYNRLFLKNRQNWANDMLQAKGHLFLNEVYRSLGIPHSRAGSVVGWKLGNGGDDYVDFGVFIPDGGDMIRHFVNGREGSILLDFNVDGVIYDQIDAPTEAISWQLDQ